MNPALQGYLAAIEESLAADGGLAEAASEMAAVAELAERTSELTLAINDAAVPLATRRAVLDDLLEGKVRPEVRQLVHQAVTVITASELIGAFHWLATRLAVAAARAEATPGETWEEEVLGRMGSRNRVSGYAAAVFETVTVAELEEIEDQLFRFARTVEADRRLRSALGDRDLPVTLRQAVVTQLLGDKVLPATLRLATYAVRAGRARDIVATLDTLVEDAAQARGWRVARVKAAEEISGAQNEALRQELGRLAGNPVDLQVTIDPVLLGGVVVQLGDLLVDSSTRHRLDELKEHVLASEAAYRIPEGREPTDG